jgi:hypothetical protein
LQTVDLASGAAIDENRPLLSDLYGSVPEWTGKILRKQV